MGPDHLFSLFPFEKELLDELETTHQQLAGELGTAREVISRLLKQMEKEYWNCRQVDTDRTGSGYRSSRHLF